jgi:hypothetical protein
VTKLSDRALPVVFLGYEPGSKAYRVVYPVQHRLYVTRDDGDVVFEEDRKWNWENKGQSQECVDKFSVTYSKDSVTTTMPVLDNQAQERNSPFVSSVASSVQQPSPVMEDSGRQSSYTTSTSTHSHNADTCPAWYILSF